MYFGQAKGAQAVNPVSALSRRRVGRQYCRPPHEAGLSVSALNHFWFGG